jgi:hypothetical protein
MNKLKMIVAMASMLVLPAALAQSVLGEKLDSGLGKLGPNYTAQEFMPKGSVLGESLDSGLGQLASDYTAWEFMPEGSVLGESLDSGLGQLTGDDLKQYVQAPGFIRTALGR